MSDELIKKNALISTLKNWLSEDMTAHSTMYGDGYDDAVQDIIKLIETEMPEIELKTGRWIFEKGDGKTCVDGYICSACGESFHTKVPYWSEFKFCPCCGARMEETE